MLVYQVAMRMSIVILCQIENRQQKRRIVIDPPFNLCDLYPYSPSRHRSANGSIPISINSIIASGTPIIAIAIGVKYHLPSRSASNGQIVCTIR